MQRRSLLLGLAAVPPLAAAHGTTTASAQPPAAPSWPDRPLRIVVPFPPGGAIDAMTRLLAPRLSDSLGQ
jgi:tripartite-type tricarboxylate transporter receptor subunit TctC